MFKDFKKIKHFVTDNFICGLHSSDKMVRNESLFYLFYLFIRMNFGLPIEFLFFLSLSGSNADAAGIVFLVYMTGTLLSVPLGILSDKIGRKKVMLLCSFSRLFSACLYAFAPSYSFLVFGALFAGVYRFTYPNVDSFLYESLVASNQEEKYHECLSKLKSVAAFSLSVGALFCGIFYFLFSYRGVMLITVIPVLLAFIISFFLTEVPTKRVMTVHPLKHFMKALAYYRKNKKLFCFTIADALHYGFNEASFTINAAFFKTIMPVWLLGVFRFLGHFTASICSYLSSVVAKKIGVNKTILFGAMSDDIVNIISVLCANWISPILKTAGSGFFGIYSPATGVFVQKEVSDEERATLVSFASILTNAVFSVATLILGWMADLFTPQVAMFYGYASAFCFNILFIVSFKQKGKRDIISQTSF